MGRTIFEVLRRLGKGNKLKTVLEVTGGVQLSPGLRKHTGEDNPFYGRLITLKNQLLNKKGCLGWFSSGLFNCNVEIKGNRTEGEEDPAMRDFEEQMSKSIRERIGVIMLHSFR